MIGLYLGSFEQLGFGEETNFVCPAKRIILAIGVFLVISGGELCLVGLDLLAEGFVRQQR